MAGKTGGGMVAAAAAIVDGSTASEKNAASAACARPRSTEAETVRLQLQNFTFSPQAIEPRSVTSGFAALKHGRELLEVISGADDLRFTHL